MTALTDSECNVVSFHNPFSVDVLQTVILNRVTAESVVLDGVFEVRFQSSGWAYLVERDTGAKVSMKTTLCDRVAAKNLDGRVYIAIQSSSRQFWRDVEAQAFDTRYVEPKWDIVLSGSRHTVAVTVFKTAIDNLGYSMFFLFA